VIKLGKAGTVQTTPFLDIDSLVTNTSGNDERGLLGLAFHPDFANNGLFFVDYTNNSSNTVIARYHVSADPDRADHGSAEIRGTERRTCTSCWGRSCASTWDNWHRKRSTSSRPAIRGARTTAGVAWKAATATTRRPDATTGA
jgi:hypothetical protein